MVFGATVATTVKGLPPLDRSTLIRVALVAVLTQSSRIDESEIVSVPVGAAFRERFGNPYAVCHRADVHQSLFDAVKKNGRLLWVCDLAKEYGFKDVDGRFIPRFDPKAPLQAFPC